MEWGGFVEEEDDAVELAFAGAACDCEAQWMKEVATAEITGGFDFVYDFFEAFGIEWRPFE